MKINGVIGDLKMNFFNLKNNNSKTISRTFSGSLGVLVGSVNFQIVPWSSLHFSRSIGPFLCSWCYLQSFNLLHLSLPKQFPLFILASVCWSLQCLISALTQMARRCSLFFNFLGSFVQSCFGEGGTLRTNITGMCGECSQ